MNNNTIEPPKAKKTAKTLTFHKHERIDNYFWLNEKDNPEVIAYLNAENAYKDAVMKHTEGLQKELFEEITGRIKQDDQTAPYFNNGYYYYKRYEKNREYPIYCRKKQSLKNNEEILLDVNQLARGKDFCHVACISVSPDNKKMIYGVDFLSRRLYTLYFKDLTTGDIASENIPNTTGEAIWANDNQTVFYTAKNKDTLRPERIFKHKLHSSINSDIEIFHEADETFYTFIDKSRSEQYLFIISISTLSTEYRFLSANTPDKPFRVLQKRENKHEYFVDHKDETFYIRTNLNALNFRIMKTSIITPEKENWQEVVAHRDDVLLDDMDIFQNFMTINQRYKGLSGIQIFHLETNETYNIKFDEETYTVWLSDNHNFNTDKVRYKYSSLTTPDTVFDYDMHNRKQKLIKQVVVVGSFSRTDYQSERVYAKATDGTEIPISLVYRKGINKNGKNPLVLYGYGSYGISVDPIFSSVRLSLLDRNFIFAIAHIRGGQEMGRQWYENGKLLKKKNTFTDFITCAEHLVALQYTNKNLLSAIGGSAGGLLIGAVMNMRPDLFRAMIAAVPFVDVVTTMLDESIPLTTGEFDEWGNPKQKNFYDYILSYSPYDNVEAKEYPALLVTTGLHDSQVQYFEPAKWVAKLRELKTDNNSLIFDIDMKVGHGGASGRFERYKTTALEYAFLIQELMV